MNTLKSLRGIFQARFDFWLLYVILLYIAGKGVRKESKIQKKKTMKRRKKDDEK
jgi:hypothetical protein